MRQGDLVVRKSYGEDVLFKINDLNDKKAVLKGIEVRLIADSPVNDLRVIHDPDALDYSMRFQDKIAHSARTITQFRQEQIEKNQLQLSKKVPNASHSYFEMPGKVLHLDGDPEYLRKSMSLYGELRVPAEGHYVTEENMPEALYRLLPQVRPNILVITGHDGLLKHRRHEKNDLNSYKNSYNFVRAIRIARQYERNLDALTIVGGACQSHFEALLQAGANFASSPGRVLIHALDPVYIAAKVSYTSVSEMVNMFDVIDHTVSGLQGLGGVESKGSYRIGVPKLKL
jgi:spore coat assembly protein